MNSSESPKGIMILFCIYLLSVIDQHNGHMQVSMGQKNSRISHEHEGPAFYTKKKTLSHTFQLRADLKVSGPHGRASLTSSLNASGLVSCIGHMQSLRDLSSPASD